MKRTQKIVLAAMFAALTFCATYVMKVPTPTGGYVNLGDSFVLTSGWILGPIYGTLAAAIGSMLSDLLGGYAAYILPTFLIKGCMALVAYFIYHAIGKKLKLVGRIIAAIVAEIVMVGGYYLIEATFLGYGFGGALAGVPGNLIQGAFGIVSAVIITEILQKIRFRGKNEPEEKKKSIASVDSDNQSKEEHTTVCQNCGATFSATEENPKCPYCGLPAKKK